MLKHAKTDQEIDKCFFVMAELRPHLKKDDFIALVRHMEGEGYRLAYLEEAEDVVAVAGYRIFTNLFMGKNLYVDDLVTAERYRSQGYGQQCIAWLNELAKQQGCQFYHLDSGTHRHKAHKFYFSQGFHIASYHFSDKLE
jgi:GNAT superfamily N-acetyltransferase